jgi:hypothetical protein
MSGLHYLQMSKQNEQKEREKVHTVRPAGLKPRRKNTYSQTSWHENPEELQLHHNHEKALFLTVLLLFAQCKMHYW